MGGTQVFTRFVSRIAAALKDAVPAALALVGPGAPAVVDGPPHGPRRARRRPAAELDVLASVAVLAWSADLVAPYLVPAFDDAVFDGAGTLLAVAAAFFYPVFLATGFLDLDPPGAFFVRGAGGTGSRFYDSGSGDFDFRDLVPSGTTFVGSADGTSSGAYVCGFGDSDTFVSNGGPAGVAVWPFWFAEVFSVVAAWEVSAVTEPRGPGPCAAQRAVR